MLNYDFDNSIGCWIALTSHAYRQAMSAKLAEAGMTLRQFEVLAWLGVEGDLSQVELAERLGIEPPTLAGVVNRMERDGWLQRSPCATDRRRNKVCLTEKAVQVWSRAAECAIAVREVATAGMTAEELATVKSVCTRLRQNLAGIATEKVETPAECAETKSFIISAPA